MREVDLAWPLFLGALPCNYALRYYRDVSAWFLTTPAVTPLPSPPRMAAPPRKEDCMAPLSRRGFVSAVGGAVVAATVTPRIAEAASGSTAASAAAAAAVDEYGQKFLD